MSLTFQLCENTVADKEAVLRFLDAHWGSQHPLVHREEFFNYYYVDEARGILQFAFALEHGIPCALAGYIRANNSDTPDIWVSIWCAMQGKNGAGLELMDALPRLVGANVMACNNIRPKTMAFYTFLGYTAGRVSHYYRLADRAAYQVAQITDNTRTPYAFCPSAPTLVPVTQALLASAYTPPAEQLPVKDVWYLTRRYFQYPHQSYAVWGVLEGTALTCLLVTRTVQVDGTPVVRIVDFIGTPQQFSALGHAIDALLQAENAEYIDCYCFGLPPEHFVCAGFTPREEGHANVIPNYLTPPLYENTEYYCFTSKPEHFTLWKADGDQDRPNLV